MVAVRMFARLHGIGLVFLPAYTPNLNPIECLWKFVKSEVLNAAYHRSFDMFKNATASCISKTGTEYLSCISPLISENIQSFCGVRILEGS
jgi:transposase